MTIKIGNKPIFGNYKVYIADISFDKFLEFATEDIACELLNGVLVINSPAGYTHEAIFRFLLTFLDQIGLHYKLGRALGSRFVVKLNEKWGPEPDIIFVSHKNKNKIKETYYEGVPDLIIEILSPSNREDDLNLKLPQYIKSGIPEIWIIDPENKTFYLYNSEGNKTEYTESENWIQSLLFPHIKLKLKWLWDDTINPLHCIEEIIK